jgi:bifunctional non-homologous end joining protein LigD
MSKGQRIELHSSHNGSNKDYNVEILDHGNGLFSLISESGPHNRTMTPQKSLKNIDYAKAKKEFDKLVKSKINGSSQYRVVSDTNNNTFITPPIKSSIPAAKSEFGIQLMNRIKKDELETYLADPAWGMQEKMDGERRPAAVVPENSKVRCVGFNRKNQEVKLPDSIEKEILLLDRGQSGEIYLDAEIIGSQLYIFDMIKIDNKVLNQSGFCQRHAELETVFSKTTGLSHLKIVPLAKTEAEKRDLYREVVAKNGEGVVFRKLTSVHEGGKLNSGGDIMKFPFREVASFVVCRINDKRSVGISIFKDEKDTVGIEVGNVTIPLNHPMPNIHDIIDVDYLYAYLDGAIYQPVYKGVRTDIEIKACLTSQLKYHEKVDLNKAFTPDKKSKKDVEVNVTNSFNW